MVLPGGSGAATPSGAEAPGSSVPGDARSEAVDDSVPTAGAAEGGAAGCAGSMEDGVFQLMTNHECHFINGTEQVRFVERHIYNREQFLHFDSDVGVYVGDTPHGEIQARHFNSKREWLEYKRSAVDRYCRYNYKADAPFTVER
ncbi:class II histocompatibility antigen, B-L beta chain-like [Pipra filicauda]|uniref:Class II histocompatibility antigen, B-L beta chain-like n=1 Tax=Pipra filicauda TaxID=649802 RepID=A0A7R5L6U9_9PASS|nr:class II histocompatibility antigen, B-L beta chain-like [Pipra filicauda]